MQTLKVPLKKADANIVKSHGKGEKSEHACKVFEHGRKVNGRACAKPRRILALAQEPAMRYSASYAAMMIEAE